MPQRIPDRPPYLAHLGNLDYEITEPDIRDFLQGCDVTSIRLIEDRETRRPKGFGYAEFVDVSGLKKALELDGSSFRGRSIKVKIADPRTSPEPEFRHPLFPRIANIPQPRSVIRVGVSPATWVSGPARGPFPTCRLPAIMTAAPPPISLSVARHAISRQRTSLAT